MSAVLEKANQLVVAIDSIARANEALAGLAGEQRRAISKMQTDDVGQIAERQRAVGRELADAEEARRQAVTDLCHALKLPQRASMADLSRAVGAHDTDVGRALRETADHARRAILDCQKHQRIVHAAAQGVMAHLDGLARQVLAHMNRAGVYASTGTLASGQAPRGIDLVS